MRVVVFGGRDYNDIDFIFAALDKAHAKRTITLLIEGGARGADVLARRWAEQRGVPFKEYEAEWDRLGLKAGPARNQLMIDDGKPEAGIAFPGGKGTEDMLKRCKKAGIPVWEPRMK